MARNRTLAEMRTDLRWQADQLGVTLRHTDEALTRIINQSIQRWREFATEQGWPDFLVPNSGALTVGPVAPFAYGEIDTFFFVPAVTHIYFLEITVNGQVLDVPQIPFEHRNQYQGVFGPIPTGASQSIPIGFFVIGPKIGIVPPAQSPYPYTIWYMPLFPDLVFDTDRFDGMAGWEEWITWDCLVKLLMRDRDPGPYGMAVAERERLQQDFLQRLRQDRPSVVKRYDLRTLRTRRTQL